MTVPGPKPAQQNNTGKYCLAVQSGGMTAAYHVGIIQGLKKRFGFGQLHRVVGSSGAIATYAYLASGQENRAQECWERLVQSGNLVRFKTHPLGKGIMNIDYLVDSLMKKIILLDVPALLASPIELGMCVSDASTGNARLFTQRQGYDIFEILRASSAIPYFYGKKVAIDGRDYYDGEIGSVTGLDQVLEEKNILVVLTRPGVPLIKMIWLRKLLRWLLIRNETEAVQNAIWTIPSRYDQLPTFISRLKQQGKNIAVIRPRQRLAMKRIDSRLEKLRQTIRQGYDDVINNNELENFFKNL